MGDAYFAVRIFRVWKNAVVLKNLKQQKNERIKYNYEIKLMLKCIKNMRENVS